MGKVVVHSVLEKVEARLLRACFREEDDKKNVHLLAYR
jgi:hypothetical protein